MVSGEGELRRDGGFVDESGFEPLDRMERRHVVSGDGRFELPEYRRGVLGKGVGTERLGEFREKYRRRLSAFSGFEVGEGVQIRFEELLIGDAFRKRGGERGYDFEVGYRRGVVHLFARDVLAELEGNEPVLFALGFEIGLDEASRIRPAFVLLLFGERPDLSEIAAPEFVDEFLVTYRRTFEKDALRYVHVSGLRACRPRLRSGSGKLRNRSKRRRFRPWVRKSSVPGFPRLRSVRRSALI